MTVEGIPIYRQHHLERGMTFVINGGLYVGTALLRGVAYTVPGTVERGYVVSMHNPLRYDLLDAVTGRISRVLADDCIEVDPRYRGDWTRSEALLHLAFGAR